MMARSYIRIPVKLGYNFRPVPYPLVDLSRVYKVNPILSLVRLASSAHNVRATYRGIRPLSLRILNFEPTVWRSPRRLHRTTLPSQSATCRRHPVPHTYMRSVPITSAIGYLSAISIAQIPVPVPISRMRSGAVATGAWCRFPWNIIKNISW